VIRPGNDSGVPSWDRTSDLELRRLSLYPTELSGLGVEEFEASDECFPRSIFSVKVGINLATTNPLVLRMIFAIEPNLLYIISESCEAINLNNVSIGLRKVGKAVERIADNNLYVEFLFNFTRNCFAEGFAKFYMTPGNFPDAG
jgi:hypothetical protein